MRRQVLKSHVWVTSHESQVTSQEPQVTSHASQVRSKFETLFTTMLSCGIYFLPFWMKRIHCNTKQTLWLNGRNISKTLLSWNHCLNFAVFRFWLGLVRAFLVWRRFAVSLVRISTRKMMQLRKLSTSWTMISFLPKHQQHWSAWLYANPNQIAAAI